MKTDLEYIREQFENDGAKAPESLSENAVTEMLKDEKPEKKKLRKGVVGGTLAASVAAVTAIAFASANLLSPALKPVPQKEQTSQPSVSSISNFGSEAEVKEALRKIYKERKSWNENNTERNVADSSLEYGAKIKVNESALVTGDASTHNSTYTQYLNVDEADVVKTDDSHIYYLSDNGIEIFSAEGKNSKKLSQIKPSGKNNIYIADFYVRGKKLIALEYEYEKNVMPYYVGEISYNSSLGYYTRSGNTKIEVYDISDAKKPSLQDSFAQSGSYCSSRMIDDELYVVSSHYAGSEDDLPYILDEKGENDSDKKTIAASQIYTPENPGTSSFLVVSGIDTSDGAKVTKTKSILGCASDIYCSRDTMIIMAPEFDFSSEGEIVSDFYQPASVKTQLIKMELNGGMNFTASQTVEGGITNAYALDEKDGNLRVATTTTDKEGKDENNLFVLDSNLKKLGEVSGFAKDESIKAVRYIGDTAYVITYEETDPLFVIDLSDSKNPKILGEVKISGFSTLLVPVDDNTILGIGYHTQDEDDDIDMEIQEGVKLALFDVSDKSNPKVLDEKIFKNCDSAVQYNPKALLVNFDRDDYTIPLNYWNYDDDAEEPEDEYGVLNFKVENGKIKIVDRYVSRLISEEGDEVERCVYVGDTIYMFGTSWNSVDKDSDGEDDYLSETSTTLIDCVDYK